MMQVRTYLRAFEVEDYRITVQWHNDPEVMSTVVGPRRLVSEEYEKKWVHDAIFDKDDYRLAVCLKKDGRQIGIVSLTKVNWVNRSAECSWMIGDKSLWGKGYATEAVQQLLEFGFQERGLHRISCSILEGNLGSRRVAQKCGFQEEGLLREAVYKNGMFHNLALCSILRRDFARIKMHDGQ
jgi:[ribosomal protein S5]-alanine N-acetyltransferase